jgi:hypothetical protein
MLLKEHVYLTCSNDTYNFYKLGLRKFLQSGSLEETMSVFYHLVFVIFIFHQIFFLFFFFFYFLGFFSEDWFDPFLQLKSGFSGLSVCGENAKKCFLVKQLTSTFALIRMLHYPSLSFFVIFKFFLSSY